MFKSAKIMFAALAAFCTLNTFAVDLFLYDAKDKGKILGFNKNHPDYNSNGMGELAIPEVSEYNLVTPITYIAASAFKDENITSLILPEKLKIIGKAAFENNPIQTLIMPDSITTIQDKAFMNCQLKKVRLSRALKAIAKSTFENNKLKFIYLPKSVTSVNDRAFVNNLLEKAQFTQNIVYIGKSAFENNALTSVVLPQNLVNMMGKAFYKNKITSITFGELLQFIGNYAFSENEIKSVTLPDSLNVIGEGGFAHNQISEIKLPNGFNNISPRTFYDNKLKYMHLNLVEFVGSEAFAKNNICLIKLTSELPEDNEEEIEIKPMVIDSKAFSENPNLGALINEVVDCTTKVDSFLDATYYRIPSELEDDIVDININGTLPTGSFTNAYIEISFDTNGGGDAPDTIKAAKGFPTEILDTLQAEKPGYDFVEWETTSENSFMYEEDEKNYITSPEDTTLKAKWILSIHKADVKNSEFFAFTKSLNLSNVTSKKISKYKANFTQNWEILNIKPEYYQIIIDTVNEGNDIAICRLNHGWNMISVPSGRHRLSNFIPRHNEVQVSIYEHKGNGSYSKIDYKRDVLNVSDGYWVHADFSRESQKYLDYKFVGDFSVPEKNFKIGWNLFGPTQFGNPAPEASDETQISFYWDTQANDYVLKNEGHFKIGCAYWLLKLPEEEPEEEK